MLGYTTRFLPRQAEVPTAGGTMSSPSGSLDRGIPTTTRPSPRHVLESGELSDVSDVSSFGSLPLARPQSSYSLSPIRQSTKPSQVLGSLAGSPG